MIIWEIIFQGLMKNKVKINIEDRKYLKHHPFKYKQINNHIPKIEKIPNKAKYPCIRMYAKYYTKASSPSITWLIKKLYWVTFTKINLHVLG
jgi:hypothetical protein